jgi:hypothetical protein
MATKTDTVKALRVRTLSPRGFFRRAGLDFTTEPVLLPLGDLSRDQVQALRAERMLVVEDVTVPAQSVPIGLKGAPAEQE